MSQAVAKKLRTRSLLFKHDPLVIEPLILAILAEILLSACFSLLIVLFVSIPTLAAYAQDNPGKWIEVFLIAGAIFAYVVPIALFLGAIAFACLGLLSGIYNLASRARLTLFASFGIFLSAIVLAVSLGIAFLGFRFLSGLS